MPKIDELAQATASSDNDELVAGQNGVVRKMTRAQVVAGLQQQLAVASGALLGRSSPGTGAPETVIVGANLVLANGTLSAAASPFSIAALPAGNRPASNDLVPVGRGGANLAVSYADFISGARTLDASQMTVIPTGATSAVKLCDLASFVGPRLPGPITLANYAVASLPSGQSSGAKAFAINGRKPGEAAGEGTGVEVFFDGFRWISVCSGSQVLA